MILVSVYCYDYVKKSPPILSILFGWYSVSYLNFLLLIMAILKTALGLEEGICHRDSAIAHRMLSE